MGSLSLIIVPVLWAIVLGIVFYTRFRNQDELNPPVTERRRQDRRDDNPRSQKRTPVPGNIDEEKRQTSERRQRQVWSEDYSILKRKLEEDNPREP